MDHQVWFIGKNTSSYFRSAQDNVRKYVGLPNCVTIASTLHKNCLQYVGVSLIELVNENAFSLATKLLIVQHFLNYHGCACT